MKPRTGGGWGEIARQARVECAARRARVLAHPDLAKLLTEPPLGYASPEQWSGYVAPKTVPTGSDWILNDSPRRRALVEICAEALQRGEPADTAGPGTREAHG